LACSLVFYSYIRFSNETIATCAFSIRQDSTLQAATNSYSVITVNNHLYARHSISSIAIKHHSYHARIV
jgi:hypothetical protein